MFYYITQGINTMRRGRPIGSPIRQNIVELLFYMKEAYGYRIHKVYEECFHTVTIESIYYHLKKGLKTGEFEISKVQIDKGDYSWGETSKKYMYKLGEHGHAKVIPELHDKIKAFLEKQN